MAGLEEFTYLILYLVLFLFLPLGLMAVLFLMSRKYRGMFDEIGFTRKEMGLLIVGSLSTMIIPLELPVFFSGRYFLALNLGGAIIPTVLSIHLLYAKKIPARVWAPSILAVSILTFLITRVQPEMGIVAEFPWMFMPAASAAVLALILYSRNSARAPALAYSTATLGSLIGADVFHLPELFEAEQFVGSIGGASVFDLVYIGGLVSFALVLLFASQHLRRLKASLPHADIARERVLSELRIAVSAVMMGRYQLAAQRALGAVQERLTQIGRRFGRTGSFPAILDSLVPDPNAAVAYQTIARYANAGQLDFHSARWAIQQSQVLLTRLQEVERSRYAKVHQRVAAFLIDGVLMAIVISALAVFLLVGGTGQTDPAIVTYTIVFCAIIVQVVYFTLLEYFMNGRTVGKAVLGLRVVEIGDRRPDFITVFTRNTIRMLDFALFLYVVSMFLIRLGDRAQRIGDRIAETIVLNERPFGPAAPPQPTYIQA